MDGWIKLYRKLLENPIMKKPELLQLWVYCLLRANHEPSKFLWGKDEIIVERGQFVTGRFSTANDLNQNPRTIYDRIITLENRGFLNIKTNNKNSLITVMNWELYQLAEQESNKKTNNKPTTNQQQTNTNKNDKNDKKKLKDIKIFSPESWEVKFASGLKQMILNNNPTARTPDDLQSWAKGFDMILRVDKRDIEEVGEVLRYSQQDVFWRKNILSADSFRNHYDKLKMLWEEWVNKL